MDPFTAAVMAYRATHAIAANLPGAEVNPPGSMGAYAEMQAAETYSMDWREAAALGLLPPELVSYYEGLEASTGRAATVRLALPQSAKQAFLAARGFTSSGSSESSSALPIALGVGALALGTLLIGGIAVAVAVKGKR